MTLRQRFLKIVYPVFRFLNRLFHRNSNAFSSSKPALRSFYDLKAVMNNGEEFSFSKLRNKKVLIVNTASDCGFTPQYEALEKLYEKEKDHLEILAFPANDFKGQENHDDSEISTFCKKH